MDILDELHNKHLNSLSEFKKSDPHLAKLKTLKYVHKDRLLECLPKKIPGIYALGGGRQIGKTTLLKQWMASLLENNIDSRAIFFLTGELIDDYRILIDKTMAIINDMPKAATKFIIIDEVTYIRDWDKGIKFIADLGILESVILMITGSDLAFLKQAPARFPGRRGKAAKTDFILYPLNFCDFVELKTKSLEQFIHIDAENIMHKTPAIKLIFQLFNEYLIHGGFLTAINDLAMNHSIAVATLKTYSDWIRGHLFRLGKQETYLKEVLSGLIKRQCSQISWNSLTKDLSIDHQKTVADYVELLELMDVVYVQKALLEHKLIGAPKKNKKIIFTDPFIFHAVRSYLNESPSPYKDQILPVINHPETSSILVEALVTSHYRRKYQTFYIKQEGEIDIAYVKHKTFYPVEVKWTNTINVKNLKQMQKYKNARIFTKEPRFGNAMNVPTLPLPLALLHIDHDDL